MRARGAAPPGSARRGAGRTYRTGSVRVRLTLLFAGLFLAAGAGVLGITYGLVSHATNGIIAGQVTSRNLAVGGTPGGQAAGQQATGTVRGVVMLGGRAAAGDDLMIPLALPGPGAASTGSQSEKVTRYVNGTRAAENDALLLYSGIALAIMAVVAAALGWFAAGRALRPLRRITAAARRIAATNLHERLAIDGPADDLRELADMIDGLFARLDASMHAQRQFAANASHELRTPLARSRTLLEVALRNPDASAASLRAACERAVAAGAEQERLIDAMLILARSQRGLDRRESLDLAATTRDVLAARGAQIAASGLAMEVTLAPAPLAGDRALVERAVANLIDNALRHNVTSGAVWITVGSGDGRAELSVANTGPRVPPEEADRLLLPFQRGGAVGPVRTRPRSGPDDGLGLGLSIVAAIATAHEAAFRITPRLEGGGLTARLVFPAAAAAPSTARPAQTAPGDLPLSPAKSIVLGV
ncbi:HAMP domain-containing sensor histidine kinase [Trebonia sp.]|uniref:sensor histidine kinase n=1 Tax=Trebonia sp. TaxID=2767075 RepID=UPI002636ECEC|nr:HAMP domain-containing sensor histidine kinase [Trebonia sp.]